jgi:small subunit ribosomal protein S27Ae
MAKEKKAATAKRMYYKIEGGKIVRERQQCPKCGPGTFMGKHKDRLSCGRCGYTEFFKKSADV